MWGGTFPFSFLRWGCLLLSNPDPGFGDQECLNKPKQCIAPFYRVHSRMVRAGFYLGLESFLRLQPGTAVDNKHLWCHPYINIPTSCCVPCLNTWDLPKSHIQASSKKIQRIKHGHPSWSSGDTWPIHFRFLLPSEVNAIGHVDTCGLPNVSKHRYKSWIFQASFVSDRYLECQWAPTPGTFGFGVCFLSSKLES